MASLPQTPHLEGEAGRVVGLQSKSLPLATSITPFVQRKTEPGEVKAEKEKDKENEKDELLRARFLDKSPALPFQRLTAEEEKPETALAKSPESLTDSFEAGDEVELRLNQSKGQGSPLPDHVRSYMEPRFGVDLSHVRVHTGSNAMHMNRAVGAQAFTHGSDIYYGAGSSPLNMELTAHELTHVVQQTGHELAHVLQQRSTNEPCIMRWPANQPAPTLGTSPQSRLMERTRGNVSQAARLAGKERRALGKLLKKHGITGRASREFRPSWVISPPVC